MIVDASPAVFSPDRKYRYVLRRRVGMGDRTVMFTMLNPSIADEEKNDNTITRDIDFANRWGFGWLVVCNAFAYCATHPRDLYKAADPVGPENDSHILREAVLADQVVVAWGEVHKRFHPRIAAVCSLLADIPLWCLDTNDSGSPKHPLYVPRTQALTVWRNNMPETPTAAAMARARVLALAWHEDPSYGCVAACSAEYCPIVEQVTSVTAAALDAFAAEHGATAFGVVTGAYRDQRDAAIARAEAAEAALYQHAYMPDPVRCLDCGGAMADTRHATSLAVSLVESERQTAAAEARVRVLAGLLGEARPHIGDEYQRTWPDDDGFDDMLRRVDAALAADAGVQGEANG